jgi:hypothetical protein
LLRQSLSLDRIIPARLDAFLDKGGNRWANIELQALDINTAIAELPGVVFEIRKEVVELNSNEEIAFFYIKLTATGGETLFMGVYDLQLESTAWWQADELPSDLLD